MQNLIKVSRKVAAADVPVLILGETGAGKEVLAHYIHESSNRSAAPFVKVHCASLPPGLIESELFGHEKGAFTGADDERQGFFETALGGTLVLDEITELPGTVQVKLLRFLDDLTIHRVGSSREIHLDVRILALTNRDIEQEVRGGRFRQDLYYRLSTFVLFVPPLRGRLADIPVLAHYFANRAARRVGSPAPELSEEFMDCLRAHSWPGNVREIRNVVESAMILSDDEVLLAEHLPEHVRGGGSKPSSAPDSVEPIRQRKEAAEEEEIRKALDRTGGNQTAAARILGVSRRTLWSKVRQYGIEIKKGG